jgi:hypothetical protein
MLTRRGRERQAPVFSVVTGELDMKRLIVACLLGVSLGDVGAAKAEISGLRVQFAGGCHSENSSGGCSLRITAAGDSFGPSDQVLVMSASQKGGTFRPISRRARELDDNGTARARFKNIPGACFRVQTPENGNDVSDVVSNTVCEAGKIIAFPK